MMRRTIAGMLLLLPSAAQAETPSLTFGAYVASEYVSSGVRFSDGTVVQPFAELGYRGFYAGAYASNLDADLTAADTEYGLSLGYRGEAGRFSYDAAVTYYLYDEAFADYPLPNYPELFLSGTLAATDSLYLTGKAYLAPEYDQTILELSLDHYTPVEGLALGARIGRVEADYGDWTYWSVGTTYQASEAITLGLAYHDSTIDPDLGFANTDGLFVASVVFAFTAP